MYISVMPGYVPFELEVDENKSVFKLKNRKLYIDDFLFNIIICGDERNNPIALIQRLKSDGTKYEPELICENKAFDSNFKWDWEDTVLVPLKELFDRIEEKYGEWHWKYN